MMLIVEPGSRYEWCGLKMFPAQENTFSLGTLTGGQDSTSIATFTRLPQRKSFSAW